MKTPEKLYTIKKIQNQKKYLKYSGFIICSFLGLFLLLNQVVCADIPSTGYATATITNPSASLTDFTLMVNLSTMPASWWTAVDTSDGTKGRAAKNDGTELATDWINFNNTSHTGWLRVLWSGTLASSGSQVLKIFPPVSTNTSYVHTDTYGSDNAYASHWEAYYTLDETVNNNAGGYIDRTKNARHGTGVSMALSAVAGKVGNAANFDGTADYIHNDNVTADFTQGTILTWATNHASGVRSYIELSPNQSTNRILLYSNGTTLVGFIGANGVASKASAITADVLNHYAFSWNTTPDIYELYVGGIAQNASLGVLESLTTVQRTLTISRNFGGSFFYLNGYQDEVQLHSIALSASWIAEEYAQTNNNSTFWGTWAWNSGIVLTVPDAPTGVTAATSTSNQATITFTPGSNGGSSILYYLASSTPSNITATSTGSPITVTSLTNGTPYTFVVYAVNAIGTSTPSSASNAVTPTVPIVIPTLAVPTVSTTTTTATFSSNITATGGANAGTEGFNYGTTASYGSATSTTG